MNIDVTMTSVLRPSIIENTLKTYTKRLFKNKNNYRLIINIDPIGQDIDPEEVLNICRKYFDRIVHNIPSEPSFPKAVKWVWSKSTSEFVFHLEDDWELSVDLDMFELVKILIGNPELACVRLYKDQIPNKPTPVMLGCRYVDTKKGFLIPDKRNQKSIDQFGLNPVLIRRSFIDEALPLMVDDFDPEKQFRKVNPNQRMVEFIKKWKYSIYGKPGLQRVTFGFKGARWREKHGFKKRVDGQSFVKWVR